jgi:hypothetical protein
MIKIAIITALLCLSCLGQQLFKQGDFGNGHLYMERHLQGSTTSAGKAPVA